MKIRYLNVLLLLITTLLTGCYEREILDYKEGESIAPVSSLNYTVNESDVIFSWGLPSSYPNDIIQPVSVVITVYIDDVKVSTVTIDDAPTAYTYSLYSSENTYRFIFKLMSEVETDDPNISPVRYSLGVVTTL